MKKLFSKLFNKNEHKPITWNDITLGTFIKVMDIMQDSSMSEEDKTFSLIDCIYKIDSNELNIQDLYKYPISILSTEVDTVEVPKEIKLNGKLYSINKDMTKITVSQFVDYTNYVNNGNKLSEVLSVFVIPKGKEYSKGYEITEVQRELLDLPMPLVQSLAFFFAKQSYLFVMLTVIYLKEEIAKMDMETKDMEKKERLLKLLEGMLLLNSD